MYMDDVVIDSTDKEVHIGHIQETYKQAGVSSLILKSSKGELWKPKVDIHVRNSS